MTWEKMVTEHLITKQSEMVILTLSLKDAQEAMYLLQKLHELRHPEGELIVGRRTSTVKVPTVDDTTFAPPVDEPKE
jgi:hypothetical protein